MTQRPRPVPVVSRVAFISVAAFSVVGAGAGLAAAPASDVVRLTAATNITLRQTPGPGAPAVAQLPLGSEVTEVGPPGMDKTWIRVRAANGSEGWLQAKLTARLDPTWRWTTYDRIIADRLARKGDGFAASVELVSFIDRVSKEYTNPDGKAQVELGRLRAISNALSAIPANGYRREPMSSWLKSLGPVVVFDEPGGRYLLADKPIWDLHTRSAKAPVADDIAWLAVTNGLGGECEGYLPCYVDWRNRLEGEYLRRHPDGRHAGTAVATVKGTVDRLTGSSAFAFDRGRDCKDLTAQVDALVKAVQVTRAVDKDATLASLGTLRRVCGGV